MLAAPRLADPQLASTSAMMSVIRGARELLGRMLTPGACGFGVVGQPGEIRRGGVGVRRPYRLPIAPRCLASTTKRSDRPPGPVAPGVDRALEATARAP
jgi:hypothetical protein